MWFTFPGIASILPPNDGIHHEWMTSEETTSSVTTRFDGDAPMRSTEIAPFGYANRQ